jgi:DNA topoisomerase-1
LNKKDIKRAPIPANVKLDDVNEDLAKKLLSLPINIGKFGDEDILGNIGKFGPYVKSGSVIASIPKGKDLFSISVDEAIELIKKKMNKEK